MDWIDELSSAWSREYPGLNIASLPPLVRLARLGILIQAFQDEVLQPFELTASDYSVLAALRRAGPPYELSPSKLYSRLERSSGGMTKILKRLEERDLVRRSADPQDRRSSLVSLSHEGLEVQEQVFNAFLSASQDLLAPISSRKVREIERSLSDVLGVFEEYFYG